MAKMLPSVMKHLAVRVGGAVDIRPLGFRKTFNTISTALLERSCGSTAWKARLLDEVKIGWTTGLQ